MTTLCPRACLISRVGADLRCSVHGTIVPESDSHKQDCPVGDLEAYFANTLNMELSAMQQEIDDLQDEKPPEEAIALQAVDRVKQQGLLEEVERLRGLIEVLKAELDGLKQDNGQKTHTHISAEEEVFSSAQRQLEASMERERLRQEILRDQMKRAARQSASVTFPKSGFTADYAIIDDMFTESSRRLDRASTSEDTYKDFWEHVRNSGIWDSFKK